MLYAIMSNDVENSLPLRKTARPAHLQRLEELQQQGRLVLAGPLPAIDSDEPGDAGFTGSLVVAEFKSLDEARAWADAGGHGVNSGSCDRRRWPRWEDHAGSQLS